MSLTINAMTQEKLSLALPVMCTVGPENVEDQLKKYAILLTGNGQRDSAHVQQVIKGVIEGEIRYLPMEMFLIQCPCCKNVNGRIVPRTSTVQRKHHETYSSGTRPIRH